MNCVSLNKTREYTGVRKWANSIRDGFFCSVFSPREQHWNKPWFCLSLNAGQHSLAPSWIKEGMNRLVFKQQIEPHLCLRKGAFQWFSLADLTDLPDSTVCQTVQLLMRSSHAVRRLIHITYNTYWSNSLNQPVVPSSTPNGLNLMSHCSPGVISGQL